LTALTSDARAVHRPDRLRPALAVGAVGLLVMSACSGGDDGSSDADGTHSATEPISIGPGAARTSPPEVLSTATPGDEPGWVARVPELAEETADVAGRAQSARLAVSMGLAAAPSSRPSGTTTTRPRSSEPYGDYAGTMTIEIAYYDYCQTWDGNLGYAGSGTYEMDAEVYVNPPAEHEGVSERSPLNLIVASETGVEGSVIVMSGQVVSDTRDGRGAVFDYWDIDYDEDSGDIEGTLTDRWPFLSFNQITTAQPIVPCTTDLVMPKPDDIAEGAELTGTIADGRIDLTLYGQSFDREVRIRAEIEAERG
jgi:hypothetical protein